MTDPKRFFAAYDEVLARWPLPVESVDAPSPYGTTRVHVCGPEDGPPLVLLHGGGATGTVWFANIGELARTHRVYALDLIGEPGRSVHDGQRVNGLPDLLAWLDATLDHLGLALTGLVGHSYGAWIALNYALHAPHRVSRLALIDPTSCFAGMSPGYVLRALPLLVRPTAARKRAFMEWETGTGRIPLDPAWLEVTALGASDFPASKVVVARRPKARELRALRAPTLLLLAAPSKVHSVRRVAVTAGRLVPDLTTVLLPDASHHSLPMEPAGPLNHELVTFLDSAER